MPNTDIQIVANDMVQSPYLYIQAAGSTGADNSTEGIHLRWDLKNRLGDLHLPKGNLASDSNSLYYTNAGFNRANDFVKIYKVPYIKKYITVVNPVVDVPIMKTTEAGRVIWVYNVVVAFQSSTVNNMVFVSMEKSDYDDTVAQGYDPDVDRYGFFLHYKGVIEAFIDRKPFFSFGIDIQKTSDPGGPEAVIKMETLSYADFYHEANPVTGENLYVSCRKSFHSAPDSLLPPIPVPVVDDTAFLIPDNAEEYKLMAENIKVGRFNYRAAVPVGIIFECYHDFIVGTAEDPDLNWINSGDFALSVSDYEAAERLDKPEWAIDGNWPRFFGSPEYPQAYKVRTDNYLAKWNADGGIKEGLDGYLKNSTLATNLEAYLSVPQTGANHDINDTAELLISFLALLRFASLDYHIARMMGLGTIHAENEDNTEIGGKKFIYLAKYVTEAPMEEGDSAMVRNHFYMTLPTGKSDEKLPETPELLPVGYGLYVPALPEPKWITDEEGYMVFDRERFVRLYQNTLVVEEEGLPPFFDPPDEFCVDNETDSIFYGVQYREQGDQQWKVPVINSDPNYTDWVEPDDGIPGDNEITVNEMSPLLQAGAAEDGVKRPIYIHKEKNEGVHEYSLYSINWFSRPSGLSNIQQTSPTVFTVRYRLLPPSDLAVQLIQPEDIPLFSTPDEQAAMNALTGDKTYVRATFNWTYLHHIAHQHADKAELTFRQSEPKTMRGTIGAIVSNLEKTITFDAANLLITSTNPVQTIVPQISGDPGLFNGELLTAGGKQYKIVEVTDVGGIPRIKIEKELEVALDFNENNPNQLSTISTYNGPETGKIFFAVESLSEPQNWDRILQKQIELKLFQTTWDNEGNSVTAHVHTETKQHNDNTTSEYIMGGMFEKAIITEELLVRSFANPYKQVTVPGSHTGIFKILFSVPLEQHAQQNVEFYNGKVRVKLNGSDEKTELDVAQIIGLDPLELYVIDKSYIDYIQPITWLPDMLVNLDNYGETVSKTSDNSWDAVGFSANSLDINCDGFIEYIVRQDTTFDLQLQEKAFGFTNVVPSPPSYGLENVNYGFYFSSGELKTIINGQVTTIMDGALPMSYVKQDIFHIQKLGINIFFYKNGEVIPSVTTTLANTISNLRAAVAINKKGDYFESIKTWFPPLDANLVNIETGTDVLVNYHPGYKVYLEADTSLNPDILPEFLYFNQSTILPLPSEGVKQTYMGIRSVDEDLNAISQISAPVPLVAIEIIEPGVPGDPIGPTFATRPDFYGKSTFTFDCVVDDFTGDNNPLKKNSIIFFRANENSILKALYTNDVITAIKTDIASMSTYESSFIVNYWKGLVKVICDGSGNFAPEMEADTQPPVPWFNFPLPNRGVLAGTTEINDVTRADILVVIHSVFFPLTEQPVLYRDLAIKTPGRYISGRKPVLTNDDGTRLTFEDSGYNPFPMVSYFTEQVTDPPATLFKVRFTDYTLDGTSSNIYFYCACEMNEKFKFGKFSAITGPVNLVNSIPPEAPGIKLIRTQMENPFSGDQTAVLFEVNNYIVSEKVTGIRIYRTLNHTNALSVRTMDLAKSVAIGNELIDDFSDLDFPPYGEPIYYRLVAEKEIINEQGFPEIIESKASELVMASVIDVINPDAPQLNYNADELTNSTPALLPNLRLKWNKTTHNATYYLYEMNATGNWKLIHTVKSNHSNIFYDIGDIQKSDDDGLTIYKRYKVKVENASGLLNIEDKELTI